MVCTDTNRTCFCPPENDTVPPGMNDALEFTASSTGSANGVADHKPFPYAPSIVDTCEYGR